MTRIVGTPRHNLRLHSKENKGLRDGQECLYRGGIITLRVEYTEPPSQGSFTPSLSLSWGYFLRRHILEDTMARLPKDGIPAGSLGKPGQVATAAAIGYPFLRANATPNSTRSLYESCQLI